MLVLLIGSLDLSSFSCDQYIAEHIPGEAASLEVVAQPQNREEWIALLQGRRPTGIIIKRDIAPEILAHFLDPMVAHHLSQTKLLIPVYKTDYDGVIGRFWRHIGFTAVDVKVSQAL